MALGLWDPHAGTIVPESHIPLWEWYLVPHQASGLLQGLRDACPGELTTLNHATPSPMHTSVLTRTCCWEMLGCTALANPHQAQDMQGPCAWGSAYHSCCTQVAIQLGRTEPQVWQEPRVAQLPTNQAERVARTTCEALDTGHGSCQPRPQAKVLLPLNSSSLCLSSSPVLVGGLHLCRELPHHSLACCASISQASSPVSHLCFPCPYSLQGSQKHLAQVVWASYQPSSPMSDWRPSLMGLLG
jgi:hypothetical protein